MIGRWAVAAMMLMAAGVWAAEPAPAEQVTVDKEKKAVTVPCKIAARKLESLSEIYPIEVVACWPAPKGKKAHETVVTFDVKPSDVHKALESLGLKPGAPATGENGTAAGPELKIFLELPTADGGTKRVPIEKTLMDKKTGLAMPAVKWHFTGSVMSQESPDKPEKVYGADLTGTLITVFPVSDQTVIQSSLNSKEEALLKMETNKKVLPAVGTAVKLVIEVK